MKRLIFTVIALFIFTGITFADTYVRTTREITEPPRVEELFNQLKDTSFTFMVSSELSGTLSAETGHVVFRAPYGFTLLGLRASVDVAPTADLIIDVNESGTTVLSTKLYIQSGSETSTGCYLVNSPTGSEYVISDNAIADDAEITIDIDSTTGGGQLKVTFYGRITLIDDEL